MNWWEYLILVNVYLVLFFAFYALLLKRETFFQLNRIYLVSASLLSFLMPLIQNNWIKELFITQTVHAQIYGSPVIAYQYKAVANTPMTIGELLAIVYIAGVGFLLLRFGWQLLSLRRIMRRADANAPYAFFNKVNVDSSLSENEIIATHEQVHVQQLHSADVMIIEAVMIVNWFNPVVYFYRFAVKHIHEFIADSYTLRNGTDKADYAMLLLSQTFNAPQHQLVSNFFNRSLLKQRIMMLQKNRSARVKLIKYGLSAPLFALMLVLSAATVNNSNAVTRVNAVATNVLSMPANKITTVQLLPPPDTINNPEPAATDTTANLQSGKLNDVKADTTKITVSAAEAKKLRENKPTDTVPEADPKQVFTAVEQVPRYPGDFGSFLGRNIHYPAIDRENNVQGKVFVQFIVEKDGSLSDLKVLRAPDQTLANEAVRVISLSPNWKPGIQNGKPVRVMYTVPINFTLSPSDNGGKSKMLNGVEVTSFVKSDTTKKAFTIQGINTADALVIVDGKEKTYKEMEQLDPKTISSITVLKDESAQKMYGDKGKYGVILITLKK